MSQDNSQPSPDQGEKDNMVATPRTEAAMFMLFEGIEHRGKRVVLAEDMAKLETELAEARKETDMAIAAVKKCLKQISIRNTENDQLRAKVEGLERDKTIFFETLRSIALHTPSGDAAGAYMQVVRMANIELQAYASRGGEEYTKRRYAIEQAKGAE